MSKSYIDTDPGIESQSIELLPGSIVLKILHELAPQELASVGSCSTSWKQLVGNDVDVANQWKSAYESRWLPRDASVHCQSWSKRFGEKMMQRDCYRGRYEPDNLYGHKSGVRACQLLASQQLLVTGAMVVFKP